MAGFATTVRSSAGPVVATTPGMQTNQVKVSFGSVRIDTPQADASAAICIAPEDGNLDAQLAREAAAFPPLPPATAHAKPKAKRAVAKPEPMQPSPYTANGVKVGAAKTNTAPACVSGSGKLSLGTPQLRRPELDLTPKAAANNDAPIASPGERNPSAGLRVALNQPIWPSVKDLTSPREQAATRWLERAVDIGNHASSLNDAQQRLTSAMSEDVARGIQESRARGRLEPAIVKALGEVNDSRWTSDELHALLLKASADRLKEAARECTSKAAVARSANG